MIRIRGKGRSLFNHLLRIKKNGAREMKFFTILSHRSLHRLDKIITSVNHL